MLFCSACRSRWCGRCGRCPRTARRPRPRRRAPASRSRTPWPVATTHESRRVSALALVAASTTLETRAPYSISAGPLLRRNRPTRVSALSTFPSTLRGRTPAVHPCVSYPAASRPPQRADRPGPQPAAHAVPHGAARHPRRRPAPRPRSQRPRRTGPQARRQLPRSSGPTLHVHSSCQHSKTGDQRAAASWSSVRAAAGPSGRPRP